MVSQSIRRTRKNTWRFLIGLSMLGLVIIASASHANAAMGTIDTTAVAQAR
jgi:hypothetical protein